jgi:hypothetical protein
VATFVNAGSVEEFPSELDKMPDILECADDSERDPDGTSSLAIDTLAEVLLCEAGILLLVVAARPTCR